LAMKFKTTIVIAAVLLVAGGDHCPRPDHRLATGGRLDRRLLRHGVPAAQSTKKRADRSPRAADCP